MGEAGGIARDAGDPAKTLEEFRRRLADLQAEAERRGARGTTVPSPDAAAPGPEPNGLTGLSDTDLKTAIEFMQRFMEAAEHMVDGKDPEAVSAAVFDLIGSLAATPAGSIPGAETPGEGTAAGSSTAPTAPPPRRVAQPKEPSDRRSRGRRRGASAASKPRRRTG